MSDLKRTNENIYDSETIYTKVQIKNYRRMQERFVFRSIN